MNYYPKKNNYKYGEILLKELGFVDCMKGWEIKTKDGGRLHALPKFEFDNFYLHIHKDDKDHKTNTKAKIHPFVREAIKRLEQLEKSKHWFYRYFIKKPNPLSFTSITHQKSRSRNYMCAECLGYFKKIEVITDFQKMNYICYECKLYK